MAVSMSIDVAGSTEAKTRLKNLNDEPDRQTQFLELFYRLFLEKGLRFYDQLTKTDGAYRLLPLALEQIFYVKGIGDEVWLLIEPRGWIASTFCICWRACLNPRKPRFRTRSS